jgi:uncharacterized protein (TIGR02646 family)
VTRPIFERRARPPARQDHYDKYREHVRQDFSRCCAYCLLPEELSGGLDNFQLDHFIARSVRPDLIHDYYNLYWACSVCNRFKAAAPYPKDVSAGASIIDTAKESFDEHYQNNVADGSWHAITLPAKYTAKRLRLNSRHKLFMRSLLNRKATAEGHSPIDWNRPSGPQVNDWLQGFT